MGSMHTTAVGTIDFAADLATLFPQRSAGQAIAAAAEAGFEAVELPGPCEEPAHDIAAVARRHAIKIVLLGLARDDDHGHGGIGGACLKRAAADAATLGCRAVNWRMPLPVGTEARRNFVDTLRRSAAQLMPHGFRLLLEPIDGPIDEAARIVEQVGARNLSLTCDVERLHRRGERVGEVLARHLPRIAHVRIAPGPFAVSGIDNDGLLRLLDRIGYRAWVGCGQSTRLGLEGALDWLGRQGLGRRPVASYAPASMRRPVVAA
jgi:hydroxypyruvate isomerase